MDKHKEQKRDRNDYPYIIHPISVFSIVKKYKHSTKSEMILCAALLHDVLEDTPTTYADLMIEFTKDIADIVLELTNNTDAIQIQGKVPYMQHKMQHMSSYALIIKLADTLDNLTDAPSEKQLKRYTEIVEFTKTSRVLTATHNKLILEIEEVLHGS
jgi:guanosine-3',5'-bis(diphosphate) 3'-pyrophosphohydrolase